MLPRTRSLDLAAGGYLTFAATMVVFVAGRAVGVASTWWVLPSALVLVAATLSALWRRSGRPWSGILASHLVLLLTFSVSAFAATLFYDASVDGRWYHQEGIIRLVQGFDPLRETLPETSLPGGIWDLRETGHRITSAPVWINHYPKASEITAAAAFALLGDIEVAKLFNFLLLASAAALAYGLHRRLVSAGRAWALVFVAAVVSNPVVLSQSWTYYTDGQLYLLLAGVCGFLVLAFAERDDRWSWMAGIAGIGLANTKFTGLVYLVVLVAAAVGWRFVRDGLRGSLRLALPLGGLAAVAVLAVGYNPYVRNTLERGHPFHPVMGNDRIEIIGQNAAPEFEDQGRLFKFLQCTWARSDVEFKTENGVIPPKIPFVASPGEFVAAANPDARVGGFGPFYGGLLLAGLLAYLWRLVARLREVPRGRFLAHLSTGNAWGVDALILAILASTLLNREMWWARYVPQMWLVPLLCWSTFLFAPVRRASWGLRATLALSVATGVAVLAAVAAKNARTTMILERDFERMRSAATTIQVHLGQQSGDRLKYLDRGIRIVPVAFLDSMSGEFCDTLLYGGIIRHDSPDLQRSFQDRSQDGNQSRRLLQLWARHRLLQPASRILSRSIP